MRLSRWSRYLLGGVLIVIMAWQLFHNGDWEQWLTSLHKALQQPGHLRLLILAVLLMPISWWLEVWKWRTLVYPYWPATWSESWRAVLSGISVSIVTPNRIGEYGGRVLQAPTEQAGMVILTTLAGSICQWLAFLVCGLPSLLWLMGNRFFLESPQWIYLWGGLGVILVVLLLYWQPVLQWLLNRPFWPAWRWLRWLRLQLRRLADLPSWRLRRAVFLAIARLITYSFQYLLLLWFFGLSLSSHRGMAGIFSIYLIQAGIPIPPGLGVITRAEMAFLLWPEVANTPLAVLSATFSLFLVNLLLPSLLGAWLIVQNNRQNPEKDAKLNP